MGKKNQSLRSSASSDADVTFLTLWLKQNLITFAYVLFTCMWVGVCERVPVHAWVGSRLLWAWVYVCVCVSVCEGGNARLQQSLELSYWDSVALDLCCLCRGSARRSCALLYVVFLIGFDVLQPMCTDSGCSAKLQSISPITALAVRLTLWICSSPLFKLEHSLTSRPCTTFCWIRMICLHSVTALHSVTVMLSTLGIKLRCTGVGFQNEEQGFNWN